MLLGEPPPTGGDLHFRLFGFPVRVHPFFWLVTLLLGMGRPAEPVKVLVWAPVVFVSILVHELGHAFLQQYFGGRPWITLYGLGGLASCNDCDRSPRSQILISLAGPMAGFVLAALTFAVVVASGRVIGWMPSGSEPDWNRLGIQTAMVQPLALVDIYFEPFASRPLNLVVGDLLQINILWGIINLLPIYPLDGGHVARELFTLGNPRRGIVLSLQLSTGAAVLVAVYALTQQALFTCIMFGLLAYGSYQALQAYRGHWG
jgi:Zn-dependent protease